MVSICLFVYFGEFKFRWRFLYIFCVDFSVVVNRILGLGRRRIRKLEFILLFFLLDVRGKGRVLNDFFNFEVEELVNFFIGLFFFNFFIIGGLAVACVF